MTRHRRLRWFKPWLPSRGLRPHTGDPVSYDRLYLDLKGARERLCRAQTHVPTHWRSDLQAALDHIDQAGSALCPQQWSRFDQPEYPTQETR